jgi:hypothetical protein
MELDFKSIEIDLKIDDTDLANESLRTPQLHNKYLLLLMRLKNKKDKIENEYKLLEKNKWLYYTGKMSEEQQKELGWEPFDLNILRTDVDRILYADFDLIELQNKLNEINRIINYIEDIVKIISNRQWAIRSAIDWMKFTNGQ